MTIEYKKRINGYFVKFHGALIACDKDMSVALSKAFARIVLRDFSKPIIK